MQQLQVGIVQTLTLSMHLVKRVIDIAYKYVYN